MNDLPVTLFVNPAAGRGRAGRSVAALRTLFGAAGVDLQVVESRGPGDLETLVRSHIDDGADKVIVVGGDGSVHEAVNGLLRAGRAAGLGVIPIGTGNDFAKACDMPLHWQDAAMLLADRLRNRIPARLIDVGRMNGRYFANSAGIGFDAKVSQLAEQIHLPIGDLVYLIALAQAMWHGVTTSELQIKYGDCRYDGRLTLASIGNGSWVGGMFQIAPMARNDDGALDLVFVKPLSNWRILRLLPQLFRGTHIGQPEIVHAPVRSCQIMAAAPVASHLDGEAQPPCSKFSIDIIESGLRLL